MKEWKSDRERGRTDIYRIAEEELGREGETQREPLSLFVDTSAYQELEKKTETAQMNEQSVHKEICAEKIIH